MAAALDISAMSYAPVFLLDNSQKFSSSQDFAAVADEQPAFEVPDYVAFDETSFVESSATPAMADELVGGGHDNTYCPTDSMMMNCGSDAKRMRVGVGCRIGFRTKSEMEILDDGFKWRKYGKKSVKNSPNPRNYFRCSSEGCGVKKRVERDREDPRFVITTYEGVHNHISPWSFHYAYAHLPVRTSASSRGRAAAPSAAAAISSSWTAQPVQSSESYFQVDI